MENEFLPLISGVIAGLLLGGVTARRRPLVWALLSVGLGLLATVATGEFKATWSWSTSRWSARRPRRPSWRRGTYVVASCSSPDRTSQNKPS